jgi:hypothetical protein
MLSHFKRSLSNFHGETKWNLWSLFLLKYKWARYKMDAYATDYTSFEKEDSTSENRDFAL